MLLINTDRLTVLATICAEATRIARTNTLTTTNMLDQPIIHAAGLLVAIPDLVTDDGAGNVVIVGTTTTRAKRRYTLEEPTVTLPRVVQGMQRLVRNITAPTYQPDPQQVDRWNWMLLDHDHVAHDFSRDQIQKAVTLLLTGRVTPLNPPDLHGWSVASTKTYTVRLTDPYNLDAGFECRCKGFFSGGQAPCAHIASACFAALAG